MDLVTLGIICSSTVVTSYLVLDLIIAGIILPLIEFFRSCESKSILVILVDIVFFLLREKLVDWLFGDLGPPFQFIEA